MANRLINQCVTVGEQGATLTLNGPDQGSYYFRVYYQQNTIASSTGSSVAITEVKEGRVIAWDVDPGSVSIDFTEESSAAPGYSFSVSGEASLEWNEERNPWPPT